MQANPVMFTFTGYITSAQTPGVSDGDTYVLKLLADNGGTSLANQTWSYADLQGFTIDVGSYHGSYSTPYYDGEVGFQTDAGGVLTYAVMYGTADTSVNSDNFGNFVGDYVFGDGGFYDLFFNSNQQGANFQDPSNWTVAMAPAQGAVPEPASWALLVAGFGMVGGAMRSRRKVEVSFG